MLVKEICQGCIGHHGIQGRYHWSSIDDRAWTEGKILCPRAIRKVADCIGISDDPPGWCGFALEHLVLQQKGVGK